MNLDNGGVGAGPLILNFGTKWIWVAHLQNHLLYSWGMRHWYSLNRTQGGPLSFRKFQYDFLTHLPPYRQHILHYILLINKSTIVALVAKALKIVYKGHTLY